MPLDTNVRIGRAVEAIRTGWQRWLDPRDPFGPTRRRLLLWNVLVLTLIVVAVGAAVYLTVAQRRWEEVDQHLQAVALDEQRSLASSRERDEHDRDARPSSDVVVIVSGFGGQTLGNGHVTAPPGFPDAPSLEAALHGRPSFDLVTVSRVGYRVYSMPVVVSGRPVGAVQVASSIDALRQELSELLLIMVCGGLAGTLLVVVGGLFLVERALVPARQAFTRQQQFVADASHELRTPIALIKATAEVLERDSDEARHANAELLVDVEREADHLGRLVDDLLDLARLDAGQFQADLAPVAISDLANDVVEQVKRLELARGLTLTVEATPNLWVRGDLRRLRQVMLILLDNAMKHTPPDGRVRLSVSREHGWARLTVSDTGEGIAPEHLPHIFERFYRVDKARSRASGGVGLGLAIARELIELHGGRIRVESEVDLGASFDIWLPLARGAASTFHPVPLSTRDATANR